MRKFSITVNGQTYEVEVSEIKKRNNTAIAGTSTTSICTDTRTDASTNANIGTET